MTYGIVDQSLPVDAFGTLDLTIQQNFEANCAKKEQEKLLSQYGAIDGDDVIEVPLSRDVVLGRGYPYQQFPGNLRLAILIDQHRATYQSSNRPNKTAISNMIVQAIKRSNGRFITKRNKDDDSSSVGSLGIGGWVVVSDEVAREKVSHGFRTKTRKNGVMLLKEAMGGEGLSILNEISDGGGNNGDKDASGSCEPYPVDSMAIDPV